MSALTYARSALFVPATRPERIPKALASGADAVIVDLEDSVAPAEKAAARDALRQFLDAHPQARVCVRINPLESPEHAEDLSLCTHTGVIAVMLPKVISAEALGGAAASGKPVWPIVETAACLVHVHEVARAEPVERLVLGTLDLSHDLDLVSGSGAAAQVLDQARFALVVASRAAGLAAPLDGIVADLGDESGLTQAAAHARATGCGGMLCIHPNQVAAVNAAFSVTAADVAWARRILEAARTGPGVIVVDGQMVDAPVVARAERIVTRFNAGQ